MIDLPPNEDKRAEDSPVLRSRWTGKPRRDMSLVQLLPNMLTVAAICAGLASIRFSAAEAFSADSDPASLLSCWWTSSEGFAALV